MKEVPPLPAPAPGRFRRLGRAVLQRAWPLAGKPARGARYARPNPDVDRMFRAFRNVSVMRPPD